MATNYRTSALFEIKWENNAVRFMATSFANGGNGSVTFTLRQSSAPLTGNDDAAATGARTLIDQQTLSLPALGSGYWTKVNLAPGIYEVDVQFCGIGIKPSVDIRDGIELVSPCRVRYLLGPDDFVCKD